MTDAEQDKILKVTLKKKFFRRRRLEETETDTVDNAEATSTEDEESSEYEMVFDYKVDIWD
jgi:hypothetical protein